MGMNILKGLIKCDVKPNNTCFSFVFHVNKI